MFVEPRSPRRLLGRLLATEALKAVEEELSTVLTEESPRFELLSVNDGGLNLCEYEYTLPLGIGSSTYV